MPKIDQLSPPQRRVIDAIQKGKSITKRHKASAQALVRDGFLSHSGEGYALTGSGHALIEEDALRDQKPDRFRAGQTVEYLNWSINSGKRAGYWKHEWQPVTVLAVGKVFLSLRFADGHTERHMARSVRAIEQGR